MEARSFHDIFRCPHCGSIAAWDDSYCRGCGIMFSDDYVSTMEKNLKIPLGAMPWNTRDRFRCVHCSKFIAITDGFCRGCGDEIEDHEKQLIKLRMSELAKENTPSLIGLAVFVLFVIWASIRMVS